MFLLILPAADLVARAQGAPGLASYGMGLRPGWWVYYLTGLALGLAVQALFERIGIGWGSARSRTCASPGARC